MASRKLRLHQYLAKTGKFPKKQLAVDAIKAGRVTVDGKVIKSPYYQIKIKSIVKLDDQALEILEDHIYIVLNKPTGYLSTKLSWKDKKLGKKSMFDLIKLDDKEIFNSLFAVGRLDEDTSGLIIITNDGKLGFKIASPGSYVEKTYIAGLRDIATNGQIRAIEAGVKIYLDEKLKIDPYMTRKAKVRTLTEKKIEITVTEGKKREVRRMIGTVGNKAETLERISIGGLKLKLLDLDPGKYKKIGKDKLLSLVFGVEDQRQ